MWGEVVDLSEENSNRLFEVFAEWSAALEHSTVDIAPSLQP